MSIVSRGLGLDTGVAGSIVAGGLGSSELTGVVTITGQGASTGAAGASFGLASVEYVRAPVRASAVAPVTKRRRSRQKMFVFQLQQILARRGASVGAPGQSQGRATVLRVIKGSAKSAASAAHARGHAQVLDVELEELAALLALAA